MTIPQHITAAIRSGKFTYCGEAQLSNFGETARKGQYVEFFLDDGPDGNSGNPFKGLSTGREKGQRFGLIAVPLGDDDAVEPPTEPKELTRSQWAAIRCRDNDFQAWLGGNCEGAPDMAAAILRHRLNIQSRKELDDKHPAYIPAKAAAWDELEAKFIEDTRLPERH